MIKSPVRVLYVLNSVGGGASLGIYEMLRGLPREPYRVYAVAPPGGDQRAIDRAVSLFDDVRFFHIPWWNSSPELGWSRRAAIEAAKLRRGISIKRSVTDIKRAIKDWEIDVVHTGTALTVSGALAAREAGVPHIWHIKECIGRANRVQFPMPDAELVRHMSQLSARVVAMSEYVAAIFRSNGCSNLDVLPDGVDIGPYLGGDSRDLRSRLRLKTDEKLVGMVASLTSSWKQHDVYIRMVGELARREVKARFIAIGPKPGKRKWPYDHSTRHYRELMRLAKGCVPEGRLTFLDFVPDPPDIMRSLDILVHTCDVEPFGRIAIEAMAAGTPVVGPASGGVAETVVHGETGWLVAPRDPSAFAEATGRLLGDEALRARMGAAGRKRVQGHYSLAEHVRRQCGIYEKALSGH